MWPLWPSYSCHSCLYSLISSIDITDIGVNLIIIVFIRYLLNSDNLINALSIVLFCYQILYSNVFDIMNKRIKNKTLQSQHIKMPLICTRNRQISSVFGQPQMTQRWKMDVFGLLLVLTKVVFTGDILEIQMKSLTNF